MELIKDKIREFRAASEGEFWELLSPLSSEKLLFAAPCNLLYRGQANAFWQLNPSIFRDGNHPTEFWGLHPAGECQSDEQVFAEWMFLKRFIDHCDSVGLSIPNDSSQFREQYFSQNLPAGPGRSLIRTDLWPPKELFDVMALAQHHRLPTRLLDWTKRSYVAAYFAASDAVAEKAKVDGSGEKRIAVWVLDIEKRGLFKELEVVCVPGSNSANLAAQRGVFTLLRQKGVRGSVFEGTPVLDEYLLKQSECPLVKVTLPAEQAPLVLMLCDKYGINGATVFPDYYGAARATLDDLYSWSRRTG
jgi:hypothetical protein